MRARLLAAIGPIAVYNLTADEIVDAIVRTLERVRRDPA